MLICHTPKLLIAYYAPGWRIWKVYPRIGYMATCFGGLEITFAYPGYVLPKASD